MLAHPYSFFLSPIFLPILIFGAVSGSKIGILIYATFGFLGIYLLSRRLNIKPISSFLSGIVYLLNGYFALQIKIGRIAEFANMCIFPWLLYFYMKSFEDRKYLIASIITFSFLIFGGSTDVLGGAVLFLTVYSAVSSLIERKAYYFKTTLFIFAIGMCLSAVRVIPATKFIFENIKPENFSMTIPLNNLLTVLAGKEHLLYEEGLIGYWIECGSYVGVLALVLFIIGLFSVNKKNFPILFTGIFFMLLVLKGPLNLWQLVRKFPYYCFQYSTGRYIIFFVLVLSIFSGFGLNFLEEKLKKSFFRKRENTVVIIVIILCLIVISDLFAVNRPVIEKTFINAPLDVKESSFVQRGSNTSYIFERSAMYPVFLMNNGIVDSYERVGLNKGKLSTKLYDNHIPARWKVSDFIQKGGKDKVFFHVRDMENDATTKGLNLDWRIVEPIQGADGKHLSYRFQLLKPDSSHYFDVVPSREESLWHVFYALFYVYSPSLKEGLNMSVGGSTCVRVWINGDEVYYGEGDVLRREGRNAYFNLKPGWNKVLLRGIEIIGGFKDSMLGLSRIEKDGKVLEDISYDALQEYKPYQKISHEYKGEAFLENGRGKIDFINITPNEIKVKVTTESPDRLIINQNFHEGWRAGNKFKVFPYEGLISLTVEKGISNVNLYFLPNDFLLGLSISIISLLYIFYLGAKIIHERQGA